MLVGAQEKVQLTLTRENLDEQTEIRQNDEFVLEIRIGHFDGAYWSTSQLGIPANFSINLRKQVGRILPYLRKNQSYFTRTITTTVLRQHGMPVFEHSPYPTDRVPCNYFRFPVTLTGTIIVTVVVVETKSVKIMKERPEKVYFIDLNCRQFSLSSMEFEKGSTMKEIKLPF